MRRRKRDIIYQVFSSLLLSGVLWLYIVLSGEYSHEVHLPLKYTNYPSQMNLTVELPKFLQISLNGKGFDLIKSPWFWRKDTVLIDLTDALKSGFIPTDSHVPTDKLVKDVAILDISPDTIYLQFQKEFEKKVPIYVNIGSPLPDGYYFSQEPVYLPDSITVKGNEADLHNIMYWETQPIDLSHFVSKDHAEIPLYINDKIGVFPKSIIVQYKVEKFIEGKIEVPIQVRNLPLNKKIFLYPPLYTLRFVANANNYKKVNKDWFDVYIDYEKLNTDFPYVAPSIVVDTTKVKYSYPIQKEVRYIIRSL